MNILYIVGKDSRCDDFELRCSLRSISQYGNNVEKVYVVGHCPKWLSDEVVKVPCEDIYKDTEDHGSRNANVLYKLLTAVDSEDIKGEFLVSFDDNFYVRQVDFNNYPHYVRTLSGSTDLPVHKEGETEYRACLANTREFLEEHGFTYINFAVHRNLHVTRKAIDANREILEKIIAERIQCDRFVLLNNWEYQQVPFELTPVRDVKISNGGEWYKTDASKTEVFSTTDFKKGSGLYVLLSGLYNNKCKYEK